MNAPSPLVAIPPAAVAALIGQVAAFVDLASLRGGSDPADAPDPVTWRDHACKYGRLVVARVYAEFVPTDTALRWRMTVAGFAAYHCPPKWVIDLTGKRWPQAQADVILAHDVLVVAATQPAITTFLLFTTNPDFLPLVTTLRNLLGKRVVICAPPGALNPDLGAAAGEADPLPSPSILS